MEGYSEAKSKMATGSLYRPTVPVQHICSKTRCHLVSNNKAHMLESWQQAAMAWRDRLLSCLLLPLIHPCEKRGPHPAHSRHSTGCWMNVVSFRSFFWVCGIGHVLGGQGMRQ